MLPFGSMARQRISIDKFIVGVNIIWREFQFTRRLCPLGGLRFPAARRIFKSCVTQSIGKRLARKLSYHRCGTSGNAGDTTREFSQQARESRKSGIARCHSIPYNRILISIPTCSLRLPTSPVGLQECPKSYLRDPPCSWIDFRLDVGNVVCSSSPRLPADSLSANLLFPANSVFRATVPLPNPQRLRIRQRRRRAPSASSTTWFPF